MEISCLNVDGCYLADDIASKGRRPSCNNYHYIITLSHVATHRTEKWHLSFDGLEILS